MKNKTVPPKKIGENQTNPRGEGTFADGPPNRIHYSREWRPLESQLLPAARQKRECDFTEFTLSSNLLSFLSSVFGKGKQEPPNGGGACVVL